LAGLLEYCRVGCKVLPLANANNGHWYSKSINDGVVLFLFYIKVQLFNFGKHTFYAYFEKT
jgi:hypothetical protein